MRSCPDAKFKGDLPPGPELQFPRGVVENQPTLPDEQGGGERDWLPFPLQACGPGQKSIQRKPALAPGEICKDETLRLSVSPDCGGEIDRNYNWQVTDLNIY